MRPVTEQYFPVMPISCAALAGSVKEEVKTTVLAESPIFSRALMRKKFCASSSEIQVHLHEIILIVEGFDFLIIVVAAHAGA